MRVPDHGTRPMRYRIEYDAMDSNSPIQPDPH